MSTFILQLHIVVVAEMKTLLGDGDYIIQLLKKSGAKTYFRRIKIMDDLIAIIPLNPTNESTIGTCLLICFGVALTIYIA